MDTAAVSSQQSANTLVQDNPPNFLFQQYTRMQGLFIASMQEGGKKGSLVENLS